MRFYKYRAVGSDLAKDYALDALISSNAIFSSRTNFNDPFDSKIHLPRPTPEQIEELLQEPGIASNGATIGSWIADGKFTPAGLSALTNFEVALNETIDRYPMLCLSDSDTNPLLWAHYASSHTGFCIEFEFPAPGDGPQQVSYREHMESVYLLDLIKVFYKLGAADRDLGDRIHAALHVKVKCWSYEGEYRWIASKALGELSKGQRIIKVPYQPSWVKAVIFGCRTSEEVKAYIRTNLPFATQFKQAVATHDHIEIVPC